jgi:hypothetical protein
MEQIARDELTKPLPEGRIKPGDTFTIEGVYRINPAWRWWKFWVPKHTGELKTFRAYKPR